jgi:hypothetical protein
MSWDAGAISNFGALTFPTESSGGGGAVSPNLVVSTLTAISISTVNLNSENISNTLNINSQNISTNNLNLNNVKNLPYQYTYGANASIPVAGFSTIVLPFSYASDAFSVIAQYNSLAGYALAPTNPIVCTTNSPSTFLIHNGYTLGTAECNYITAGLLN